MPISIRPLADTDLESAADILTSAFHRSGNWANELRLYREVQPDGYFGAYQEGALVGMVGSIIYSTFAYIGMMGVHQQFQRRGIGLALMQHLLKWLDGKNIPQVQLDASEAGQPMYEKLGFVAHERVFVLQRQAGLLQLSNFPDRSSQCAIPIWLHWQRWMPKFLGRIAARCFPPYYRLIQIALFSYEIRVDR